MIALLDVKSPGPWRTRRLACSNCGYSKDWAGTCYTRWSDGHAWYFDIPLWLQTPCCGQVLWAFNEEHLAFLEQFVSASVRERTVRHNGSLASRLPSWLQAARNRVEVSKGLQQLRDMLD
jgi:hypothetical protein